MQKFFISLLLTGLIFFCFSQDKIDPVALLQSYEQTEKIFQQAERQSIQAGDNEKLLAEADQVYSRALGNYLSLLPQAERSGNDSLTFRIKLRTAFIHYYFDSTILAKKDYLTAIGLKRNLPAISDTVLFIPSLYTGAIYYEDNQFDSALLYYKKAEQINDAAPHALDQAQRLYNRLGVLFYEAGNYRQARNYFQKAISLTGPADKDLLINYRMNVASLLVKEENFDAADSVYRGLLPSLFYANEIYHNLGVISLKKKEYQQAIQYLRKTHYNENRKETDLYYNFAIAFSRLGQQDSSRAYVARAIAASERWAGNRKSIIRGLIFKFEGDELLKKDSFQSSVDKYQQAILQFHNQYDEVSFDKNPQQFSGVYSFINLFNTLISKAEALEKWFAKTNDEQLLPIALNTYQSAFALAAYVEQTYSSDEARLFLGNLKYAVHDKPILLGLRLFHVTNEKKYIEAAYNFDQQNKAAVLALTIRENDLKNQTSSSNEWIRKENLLKTAITRLSLKAANITDNSMLEKIQASIRDSEIELGKVLEKLNDDPTWVQKRLQSQIPTIQQVQEGLDKKTALFSYHLSSTGLTTIFITNSVTNYRSVPIDGTFFDQVLSFSYALHNISPGQRFNDSGASSYLYRLLVDPFENQLAGIERLIIIPDDELSYIPFEALKDDQHNYLVQKFSVQYEYTTALFEKNKHRRHQKGILSFAPFASDGNDSFRVLTASKNEIEGLNGKQFFDANASKENFLRSVNHYGAIHLATHASVNNNDPSQSFIAFNPSATDHKLFAQEIADLQMDSTELVILSACETGTGQLIKGEGLMSLSRAFAYAGCPNIITSLWKAEDKATAFLMQRLHHYLDKNYTRDKALQQAKLDLLASDEMTAYKSPGYWAHIIFIGDYEKQSASSGRWLLPVAIVVIVIAGFFITKSLFAKSKQARFS